MMTRQGLGAMMLILGALNAMGVDEAKYTVVETSGIFEVRDYERQILVETRVDSSLEDAGNIAFRRLFRYISGANQSSNTIAMTAPVSQEARGEKIAMTAPVGQQQAEGGWAVSFMMPAHYTLQTLPQPTDPTLSVRDIPARRVAAVRYTGTWSRERYLHHKGLLEAWLRDKGLTATGAPIWARYNPPFTLWFLRRNEVLIPVAR
ncbi:MAG: heme-binding protein [bacterium]